MIKILTYWLLLILFSPFIFVIASVLSFFWFISDVVCELNKEVIPYITWKIKNVREIFRKKDSN